MDTLTHALSGALVAAAVVPAQHPHVTRAEGMALGFVCAALPDADVVLTFASPLAYLYQHRGVTHSLLLLPLWAWAIAWIWSRPKRKRAGFPMYFVIAALAIGLHILGDLITSFGTIVFAPLADVRVKWDTTFIIDLWLSGIIIAGLAAGWAFRRSRLPAIAGLVVACGYVGFQWLQQQRAIEVGEAYARAHGIQAATVSALPRPVSPFNWMVIVSDAERYHFAFVNLRRRQVPNAGPDAGFIARLDSHYLPVAKARWQSLAKFGEPADRVLAEAAWRQAGFGFFRWFSAYPVLARVERANAGECAWFQDLRFLTPGRDDWPFRYGMCRTDGDRWQAFQAGDRGELIALDRSAGPLGAQAR